MDAAAVRTPPKVPRPQRAPVTRSREIDLLWRRLCALDARELPSEERGAGTASVVEDFWQSHPESPLVEDAPNRPQERIVTFLWRDADAEEVLLFVNRLTDERNLADSLMRRIPGTDVWHLSYRMRSGWRASYGFAPRHRGQRWAWSDGDQVSVRRSLDRSLPDPRNVDECLGRAGNALSVVTLPDAPAQPWLARREGVPRGTVTEHEGPDGRTVWVYESPGTDAGVRRAGRRPLPVVVALDGDVWTSSQDLAGTLDNLIHDGELRPPLVVMPDSGGTRRRWTELDGTGAGPAWIADRLLPWARARWAVSTGPADVVVAGQSLGGLTALRAVLERPDAVGSALSQSASLWQHELTVDGRDLAGIRVYQEVGTQEWVLREPNEKLAARLAVSGADVHFVEYDGGHDYACWRGGIADGLRRLLPPGP